MAKAKRATNIFKGKSDSFFLKSSVFFKRRNVVKFLLEKGANPKLKEIRQTENHNAITMAKKRGYKKIFDLLNRHVKKNKKKKNKKSISLEQLEKKAKKLDEEANFSVR